MTHVSSDLKPARYWQDDAECQGMPLELFFGTEDMPLTNLQATEGRRLCAKCLVSRDCLLDALLSEERSGLRGGFLGHERRQAMAKFKGSISAAMKAFDHGGFYVLTRRRR